MTAPQPFFASFVAKIFLFSGIFFVILACRNHRDLCHRLPGPALGVVMLPHRRTLRHHVLVYPVYLSIS